MYIVWYLMNRFIWPAVPTLLDSWDLSKQKCRVYVFLRTWKFFPSPFKNLEKFSHDRWIFLSHHENFSFFSTFQEISSLFLCYFFPICYFLPFSFVFLTCIFSLYLFFYTCVFSPANLPHLEKLPQPLEKLFQENIRPCAILKVTDHACTR